LGRRPRRTLQGEATPRALSIRYGDLLAYAGEKYCETAAAGAPEAVSGLLAEIYERQQMWRRLAETESCYTADQCLSTIYVNTTQRLKQSHKDVQDALSKEENDTRIPSINHWRQRPDLNKGRPFVKFYDSPHDRSLLKLLRVRGLIAVADISRLERSRDRLATATRMVEEAETWARRA